VVTSQLEVIPFELEYQMTNLTDYCVHRTLVQQLHITCLTRKGGEFSEDGFYFWTARRAIDALATIGCHLTVPDGVDPNRGCIDVKVGDRAYRIRMPHVHGDRSAAFTCHGWRKSGANFWQRVWEPRVDETKAVGRFLRYIRYHLKPLNNGLWAVRGSIPWGGHDPSWFAGSMTHTKTVLRIETAKPMFANGPSTKQIPEAAVRELLDQLRLEQAASPA
jgi:hypothetical protein